MERDRLPADAVLSRLDDVFEMLGMLFNLQGARAIFDKMQHVCYVTQHGSEQNGEEFNPKGAMMRRLAIQTARRRQYNVPASNHLWHIDGNHKLIRSSDKGGENVKVTHFMVRTMGNNRDSYITGRSVHNQHQCLKVSNSCHMMPCQRQMPFAQVGEEYGVDWTGPHNNHPSTEITIPEIQLPRGLNEQEVAALPNTSVPLS
ncbi:hypothetical protein Q5P01_015184 [Channa striata]|uniref:Integrase core domain-containing protein n=1 Tax=Channa striata TaxID=64152 RepID=A0AA88MLG3_CHASR|nr:hypothetical protein Q5P01_015184 [Channa striata]